MPISILGELDTVKFVAVSMLNLTWFVNSLITIFPPPAESIKERMFTFEEVKAEVVKTFPLISKVPRVSSDEPVCIKLDAS